MSAAQCPLVDGSRFHQCTQAPLVVVRLSSSPPNTVLLRVPQRVPMQEHTPKLPSPVHRPPSSEHAIRSRVVDDLSSCSHGNIGSSRGLGAGRDGISCGAGLVGAIEGAMIVGFRVRTHVLPALFPPELMHATSRGSYEGPSLAQAAKRRTHNTAVMNASCRRIDPQPLVNP